MTQIFRRFANPALIVVTALVLASANGHAQNGGQRGAAPPSAAGPQVPTGRQGRGGYPLPPLPAVFETYQHKVRVSVVARGIDRPWSLLVLPDGDMLVSMRYANQIRAIRKGVLDPKPLTGLPEMRRLFDIAIHPKFADNRWIYFGYSMAGSDGRTPFALARGRYEGGAITNVQELYVRDPLTPGASRMAF